MPNNEKMPVQNFDHNENEENQVVGETVQENQENNQEQTSSETESHHSRINALKNIGYVPLSLESTGGQVLNDDDIDIVHGWLTDPQIPEDAKKKFLEERNTYINEGGQEDPLQSYLLWDPKTNSFYRMDRI